VRLYVYFEKIFVVCRNALVILPSAITPSPLNLTRKIFLTNLPIGIMLASTSLPSLTSIPNLHPCLSSASRSGNALLRIRQFTLVTRKFSLRNTKNFVAWLWSRPEVLLEDVVKLKFGSRKRRMLRLLPSIKRLGLSTSTVVPRMPVRVPAPKLVSISTSC
ncbi:hypothetical protein F5051DRAFT_417009, partial [Lentinula edodes]